MSTEPVKKAVRGAVQSRPLRFLARLGFAVSGLVHGLIGLLAIGVAFGGSGEADQGGAMSQIASSPGGTVTLWIVTIATAALGLWLILGAFLFPSSDPTKRVAHILVECGKGAAYLLLAATAVTFALGGEADSEAAVDSMSRTLIAAPGGLFILLFIALGILVIGGYFVIKGARRRFVDDIDLPSGAAGTVVVVIGVFGYIAKGVALAFTGVLLGVAAVKADPSEASGLDGSLHALAQLPFGPAILTAIGAGFLAYGLYCFVRAVVAKI
jgi:hypothetical protein